jgi:hypothetical protein
MLADLRGGQVSPGGELIQLTGWIRNAIDPDGPTTPALAVIVLGWLEAAEQVLATGGSSQESQVLLSVADRHGQPPSPRRPDTNLIGGSTGRSTAGCSAVWPSHPA